MRRLLVVYNPRSSRFREVEKEVLTQVRDLKGWMVGKFEVKPGDVDKNAAELAKVVMDGDLIVAAGGDATATIAANGVMLAKRKNVSFGSLGFGNFNDVASMLRTKELKEILEGETQKIWPLECLVNGKHYRYGMCYFTIGLFAEACAVFDEKKVRRYLQNRWGKLAYSVWVLAKWYVKNRKREFLKDFEILSVGRGELKCDKMSDYVALNGRRMARVMRGGEWFLTEDKFLSEVADLRKFRGIFGMMARSILAKVPGSETKGDELTFAMPSKIMIQAEGEYKMLEGVKKIEIRKAAQPLEVVLR